MAADIRPVVQWPKPRGTVSPDPTFVTYLSEESPGELVFTTDPEVATHAVNDDGGDEATIMPLAEITALARARSIGSTEVTILPAAT